MTVARIVVGVDGSENARQALVWAAGLAEQAGAELVAVHALGLLEHGTDARERFETEWCAPLDAVDVPCRREVRDGNPVQVLLALGAEVDADLLVVGSRGLGGFPELLLGSTSTQVAQHATRPVVIVPAGAQS